MPSLFKKDTWTTKQLLALSFNLIAQIAFQTVRDGLARVYLFQIPRESGCKPVTNIINEKCDVTRPSDPMEKVKVIVTGIGANLFKDELEQQLNAE